MAKIESLGLIEGKSLNRNLEIRGWTRYKDFNDGSIIFYENILDMNDNNTRYYQTYIESSRNCSTYYNDELLQSQFVTNLDEQFT